MDEVFESISNVDRNQLDRDYANKVLDQGVVNNMLEAHTSLTVQDEVNLEQLLGYRIDMFNKAEAISSIYEYELDEFRLNNKMKAGSETVYTKAQVSIFEELFQKLEGVKPLEEVDFIVSALNEKAVNELDERELEIVLLSTTMLINSSDYWFKHEDEWLSLLSDEERTKLKTSQGDTPWYISVAKADMAGLVSGAVSGFILGAANGSIGGPAFSLAGALGGAAVGSVAVSLGMSAGTAVYALFK